MLIPKRKGGRKSKLKRGAIREGKTQAMWVRKTNKGERITDVLLTRHPVTKKIREALDHVNHHKSYDTLQKDPDDRSHVPVLIKLNWACTDENTTKNGKKEREKKKRKVRRIHIYATLRYWAISTFVIFPQNETYPAHLL